MYTPILHTSLEIIQEHPDLFNLPLHDTSQERERPSLGSLETFNLIKQPLLFQSWILRPRSNNLLELRLLHVFEPRFHHYLALRFENLSRLARNSARFTEDRTPATERMIRIIGNRAIVAVNPDADVGDFEISTRFKTVETLAHELMPVGNASEEVSDVDVVESVRAESPRILDCVVDFEI